VMPIMKDFKVLGLGFEVTIAPKPLGSEGSPIIGIIETPHGSITPRFSNRGKDYFDPQQQTESEDNDIGTRVAIAPPKTELVVNLKKVGDSYGLPAANQALSHGLVVFSLLGVKKDPVAIEIHDIE
jgi:hypothetical protein